jgi:hypothetical protein
MARTSIEDRAAVANAKLAKFVGCHEAHSMGYLYELWKMTQMLRLKRASKSSILLYSTCVEPLGEELANRWFEGLQLFGFIEKKGDDDFYVKGNGDHIKNLKKLEAGQEKGGKSRANTAERDDKGRLKSKKTSSSSPPARSETLTSSVETPDQLGPNIDPAQCKAMQGNARQCISSSAKNENEEKISPRQLAELWNEIVTPPIKRLALGTFLPGKPRWVSAQERLDEVPDLAYWRQVIERIEASPHCRGKNDRGWVANFQFLIWQETHVKALEGLYDGRGSSGRKIDYLPLVDDEANPT